MLSRRTVSLAIAELLVIHGLELRSAAGYDLRSPIYDIGVDKCGLGSYDGFCHGHDKTFVKLFKETNLPPTCHYDHASLYVGWLVGSFVIFVVITQQAAVNRAANYMSRLSLSTIERSRSKFSVITAVLKIFKS